MAARIAARPDSPRALPGVEFVHGAPEDEDEYLLNTYGAEETSARRDRPTSFFSAIRTCRVEFTYKGWQV